MHWLTHWLTYITSRASCDAKNWMWDCKIRYICSSSWWWYVRSKLFVSSEIYLQLSWCWYVRSKLFVSSEIFAAQLMVICEIKTICELWYICSSADGDMWDQCFLSPSSSKFWPPDQSGGHYWKSISASPNNQSMISHHRNVVVVKKYVKKVETYVHTTASKKMSWCESTKHTFLKVAKWC